MESAIPVTDREAKSLKNLIYVIEKSVKISKTIMRVLENLKYQKSVKIFEASRMAQML